MKPAVFLLALLVIGIFSYFYVEPVLAPTRFSSSAVTWSPNFPTPSSITVGNITLLCNVTEITQTTANFDFLYWFQYNTTPAGGWLNMTKTDANFVLNTSIPITFTQPGTTGNFNTSVESANVLASPGSYMTRCQGNNDTSGTIITGNIINITVNPSNPYFSGNATSKPSGYGYDTANNLGFQINYSDVANDFSNATFQLGRPVGTLTNYTQCGSSLNCTGNSSAAGANVWLINFTQALWGKAGTYNYTWFGTDIDGSQNKSSTVNYTINKANTSMRLFLNGTENNKTYNQNNVANFTANLNVSKTITLRSNYTGFIDQTGTQTIFNYTTLGTLGNFFNLTAFWNGDENYTANQKDYLFNVTSVVQQVNNTVGEKIIFSDSPNKGRSAFKAGADNMNMLDSYPEIQSLFRSSPQTVSLADASGKTRNIFGPVGEPITLGDILGRIANLFRIQPETISAPDSSGKMRSSYETNSELLNLNDIGGRILNFFRNNAETITVLDSGGKARSVQLSSSELLSLSDIGSRIASFFRTQSETVSIYDAANTGQGKIFLLTVPETISFYDSINGVRNFFLTQTEPINFNDVGDRIRSLLSLRGETISVLDSSGKIRTAYQAQGEMISFNDIAGRLLNIFRAPSQAVSVLDGGGRTRNIFNAQSELITLNDIGNRVAKLFRANAETLVISDTGIKIRYAYGSGSDLINVYTVSSPIKNLFRANGDALTITDSGGKIVYVVKTSQDQISVFDGGMKLRSVYLIQNELVSFSDIANRILSLFRAQGETINIQDAAGKSGGMQNIIMSILENIGFTESPTANQILFRSSSDMFSISDIAGRIRSLLSLRGETISVLDSSGKIRSAYQAQPETISLGDIGGRVASLFRAGGDAISAADISGRILNLFRTQPDTVSLYDSTGKLRSVFQTRNELIGIGDISGRILNIFKAQQESINLNDIGGRIASMFRASPETINIGDSVGKLRSVFFARNELVNLYDSYGKVRNVYLSQGELISLNDFANRMLNLFRLAFESINVYDLAGKPRMVNITSFTAQASLYQNQYQTFDLALNNTGQDNTSVDYNITIYNSAGSVVDTVQCPASTCPYNLAVGQTLISTTSWFTGSNAVGSYTAQAVAFYGGANVSGNVPFSIVATPSQTPPSPGGGSGGYAVSTPVVQPILPLGNIGVEFSGFTVLREITAGEAFAAGVRIKNSDKVAHGLTISMSGLPESWITVTPEKQVIPANSEAVANILIATPPNIVPADYRVETSVSSEGGTVSKTFFIMRVKNMPDILNMRPVVNREVRIDRINNQTEVSIFVVNGKNPVQMTSVTERIPKALAQSVSDVSFDAEPSRVVEKDPVVQWDVVFNPGEDNTKIIKYRVKKILDDYSQYIYWNLEQLSIYPYLAGALPFSFKSSANTLAKDQFNPVAIEMMNDGNASFDATLSFETPEGWVIIPKEVSRTVKPGESGIFPFEIKPEIATEGAYTLALKAVIDGKTYSQQIDFYVSSFSPVQLILPAAFVILILLAAYAIVRAKTRRSRPNISHALDVIRDR